MIYYIQLFVFSYYYLLFSWTDKIISAPIQLKPIKGFGVHGPGSVCLHPNTAKVNLKLRLGSLTATSLRKKSTNIQRSVLAGIILLCHSDQGSLWKTEHVIKTRRFWHFWTNRLSYCFHLSWWFSVFLQTYRRWRLQCLSEVMVFRKRRQEAKHSSTKTSWLTGVHWTGVQLWDRQVTYLPT